MKYYELDKEEAALLDDFDKGMFVSVSDTLGMQRYRAYARGVLNRERTINIWLSERDVQKLKAKAAALGIPYQTLVASVLHRYSVR